MLKVALRGCAFAQGRRIRPKPFPLKRSGPPAGSLTRGAQQQAVFNLPRALRRGMDQLPPTIDGATTHLR